jgi:hypothetical protein
MTIVCAFCGHTSEAHRSDKKYCSQTCGILAFRKRHLLKTGKPYDPKLQPSYIKARGRRKRERELAWRKRANSLTKGIHKRAGCWYATFNQSGIQTSRGFSIKRLGNQAAKLAATFQRMVWLLDHQVWRPEEGDPLKHMSYADLLRGNGDYTDAAVDDVSSPWLPETEEI